MRLKMKRMLFTDSAVRCPLWDRWSLSRTTMRGGNDNGRLPVRDFVNRALFIEVTCPDPVEVQYEVGKNKTD